MQRKDPFKFQISEQASSNRNKKHKTASSYTWKVTGLELHDKELLEIRFKGFKIQR
jgi:hypothetical protein